MEQRARRDSIFVPATPGRLWLGIAIAVVAPIVITPLVRTGSLSLVPGVPYVLAIVAAALVGRLIAAGIAVLTRPCSWIVS